LHSSEFIHGPKQIGDTSPLFIQQIQDMRGQQSRFFSADVDLLQYILPAVDIRSSDLGHLWVDYTPGTVWTRSVDVYTLDSAILTFPYV